jgi:hypothetical protein
MTARRATLAAALAAVAVASAAGAAVSTGEPAALLVFPLISVDGASGTDTLVELANTDEAAVGLRCLYENPSGPEGVPSLSAFFIHLMAAQPVAWRASAGLDAVPGSGGDSIPGLGTGAFTGILRCLAATPDGMPTDRNVLVGNATVEHFGAAAAPDSARYDATGVDALPGGPNGDTLLVLGGPAAEYAGCPESIVLQSFLDGATLALGSDGALQRGLSTTLALVTCASHLFGGTSATVDLVVTNEFGQTAQATRALQTQLVAPLSQIDTDTPSQSIFRVGTQGSLTGAIRITPRPGSSGVLALAVAAYADPNGGGGLHSAAISPQLAGERSDPDLVNFLFDTTVPVCVGDCNGNGTVAINELITGVTIALGNQPLSACPAFDANTDQHVAINELIAAVKNALMGCPSV